MIYISHKTIHNNLFLQFLYLLPFSWSIYLGFADNLLLQFKVIKAILIRCTCMFCIQTSFKFLRLSLYLQNLKKNNNFFCLVVFKEYGLFNLKIMQYMYTNALDQNSIFYILATQSNQFSSKLLLLVVKSISNDFLKYNLLLTKNKNKTNKIKLQKIKTASIYFFPW